MRGPSLALAGREVLRSAIGVGGVISSASARSSTALVTWNSTPSGAEQIDPSGLRLGPRLIGQLQVKRRRIRRPPIGFAGRHCSLAHRVSFDEPLCDSG
jgi:hypothetical protein